MSSIDYTRKDLLSDHPKIRKQYAQMLRDLLRAAASESPARQLATKSENDMLHGGVVFASEVRGWEKFCNFVAGLIEENPDEVEPPDRFAESEIQ